MPVYKASRRDVLVAKFAAIFASALPTRIMAAAKTEERPNILWLVSEDNNPLLGAYGDPFAHTPVIDSLAKRGILYRYAYANAPVCALSRFGILTGVYPESCGPANQMRAEAHVAGFLKGYPEYLREVGYYCTNNAKTDYNCDIDPQKIWDESSAKAHWRNRLPGKPFVAVFNHDINHEGSIFTVTDGRAKADDMHVPAYLPDTATVRQDIASYYNRIEMMDSQLGLRLAELEADGLTEDTIIFYYSDHGGVLPRSKMFCNEAGLRASLIITVPPKYAHLAPVPMGSEIDTPVSFIDLAPTLLALAGVTQPKIMEGKPLLGRRVPVAAPYVFGARDRMDERYDTTRSVLDGRWRYIRNYMPHRPLGQHYAYPWQIQSYQEWESLFLAGKLNETQAAFFKPKPFEELYDLGADTDQIVNLAGRAEHQDRLQRLSYALDAHMVAINDNGFIPEGSPVEGYENSRKPGAYPIKEIMSIAAAAASRDPANLARFRVGLADDNEIIRYWSAQGLLLLGQGAKFALGDILSAMKDDPSPHVRIVLAEAACGLGEVQSSIDFLAAFLDHPVYPVRLYAMNALTYVGPAARRAITAIEKATERVDVDDFTVHEAGQYLLALLGETYNPTQIMFGGRWFDQWVKHRSRLW